MAKCPDNGRIPRACADKFEEIGERLVSIETKLDDLCESSRTWGNRAWSIAKGIALMVAGFFLASWKR